MEDQFANILQRNYGLKTVGKSASYGPRSDERASARALDRGKSVGSGLGRINQSAAAALLLAGDNLGSLSKSARQADPPSTYGSAPDRGFRGSSKSTSTGGFDEMFGGARSGSASGSSFAEFLEGSVGKSTAASSDSPFNEDVPTVASQSRSGPKEESTRRMDEREATEEGVRRRSFRSAESRRSTEGEFLDSLIKEAKGGAQAGSIPISCDSPRSQTPKSTASDSAESPLKGSFMRGFGRSRAARSATQLSTGSGDSQGELSAGETTNGLTGNRLRSESNRQATSGRSSLSMDGSEVESIGRPESTTGFTIPASNGTAFPDLNEAYAPCGTGLPAKRSSELKMSSPESDRGETLRDSSEKFPNSPKTPAAATPESKDSPGSGGGPFAPESRNDASAREASADESVPVRRAVGSPTVSPSYVQRSRRSTRSDAADRPNGRASNIDEPLTKFEVNLPAVGASGGSHRGRRKSDSLADVWLTVDQIRLVTQPSSWPPPSRAPPPPPLARRYSGSDGHRPGQKSQPPEATGDGRSRRPEATESEKQRSSPNSEASSTDKLQSGQSVQERADVGGSQVAGRRQVYGTERANGGAQKAGENQKTGYVLPEVTVVDLGAEETKPSREERRRTREQIERDRRRAKREEERLREKERVQKEGLTESMFKDTQGGGVRDGSEARGGRREKVFDPRDSVSNDADTGGSREPSRPREGRREKVFDPRESLGNDTDASGGRQPSRPREGRREKVFDPRERHSQETATRRDEKDIQYRVLRQQEKEFRARLARQEEARDRDRENERSGDRLRRSAEKAALEAQERAERAAVERAVQEAHERAERAARHRAAAAREKEHMKEKERERERERDREEEKLRDRLRERERGLAEQLRSRDSFRATSEPRQRPSVSAGSPSGLSRFSSGGSLSKLSGPPEARNSPSAQKAVEEWANLYSQPTSGIPERFQEIPGEPADRRKLRLEKQMLIEERAAAALREKNMRDLALQREQEERQRFASSLDADVRRWSLGKEGNLRALLSTLHIMLWPECNWKVVSMSDLVSAPSVKKAYQRAILCVHPDKVQQKGANVKQKYIAEKVFDLLKDAYAKFNSELGY